MIDLYQPIIQNSFVFIDWWTFVHILTVGLITYFLNKKYKSVYMTAGIVLIIIFLYEIIEPSFTFFEPETTLDTLWDIIIGILTFVVVTWQMNQKR